MYASIYSSTNQNSTAKWQLLRKSCFQSFNFFPGVSLLKALANEETIFYCKIFVYLPITCFTAFFLF